MDVDYNQVRRDLIQIRDWAQRLIDKLQPPPPAIEGVVIPPNSPPPAPAVSEVVAPPEPTAPEPVKEITVDKTLPMFVWKRSLKGFTVEFWPDGEKFIPDSRRNYVKAYNVKNTHYGLTLSELAVLYPLPAEQAITITEIKQEAL